MPMAATYHGGIMPSDLFHQSEPRPKIGITEQIACVNRELALRYTVYPKQVKSGKISERLAQQETERMEAVLATLKWVQANKGVIVEVTKRLQEDKDWGHAIH